MGLVKALILLIRASVRTRTPVQTPHISLCLPFCRCRSRNPLATYNENNFPFLFELITRLILLGKVRRYVGRDICWYNTSFGRIHLIVVLFVTTNLRFSTFVMQQMKVCLPKWLCWKPFSYINQLSYFVLGLWLFMWEEAKQYGIHPSNFFSHSSNSPLL